MGTYDESQVVRVAVTEAELTAFKILAIQRGTTVPRALAALMRRALQRAAELERNQLTLEQDR